MSLSPTGGERCWLGKFSRALSHDNVLLETPTLQIKRSVKVKQWGSAAGAASALCGLEACRWHSRFRHSTARFGTDGVAAQTTDAQACVLYSGKQRCPPVFITRGGDRLGLQGAGDGLSVHGRAGGGALLEGLFGSPAHRVQCVLAEGIFTGANEEDKAGRHTRQLKCECFSKLLLCLVEKQTIYVTLYFLKHDIKIHVQTYTG